MSVYIVYFNVNGSIYNVQAKQDMLFPELIQEFNKFFQYNKEDKPSYNYNGKEIKAETCKSLQELGIISGAMINIMGIIRQNMPNNAGNFAMGNQGFNQNQGMGNMGFMGMGNNQMPFNPGFGMQNMYGNYGMGNPANMGNFNNMGNPANMGNFNNMGNPSNMGNFNNMGNPANMGNFNNMGNPSNMGNNPNMGNPSNMGNNPNMGNPSNMGNNPNMGNPANIGNVVNDNNINILFTLSGKFVTVQGELNMKFSEAIKKFFTKSGVTPEQQPIFILNSIRYFPDEEHTLSELNLHNQSKIEVVLQKDVVGA